MSKKIGLDWNEVFPEWEHSIIPVPQLAPYLTSGPQSLEELEFAQWIFAQPKIELHVHLEAAVPASFFEKLNEKTALFAPGTEPTTRLPFMIFRDFIRAWFDHTLLVSEATLLSEMVVQFARLRCVENIVYSEVHVSPLDFCHFRERFGKGKGLALADCLQAYLSGAQMAEKLYPATRLRFIVDAEWPALVSERNELFQALQQVMSQPESVDRFGDSFFCAIGLGGPELIANIDEVSPFLDSCRQLGLKVDIHTGETTDSKAHQLTTQALSPDRIAHGISGANEGFFFEKHISMCPTSNILTGCWQQSLDTHPVFDRWESQKSFSVNTDDPLLFGTALSLEYVALKNAFGWGKEFFNRSQSFAREAAFSNLVQEK